MLCYIHIDRVTEFKPPPMCHVCCLVQVREAYQAKGWVLNNVQNIEQCKDDGYLQMINEQQGEGCHMWGHLSVSSRQAASCGHRPQPQLALQHNTFQLAWAACRILSALEQRNVHIPTRQSLQVG